MSNKFPVWYLCHLYFSPKFCFDMILWHDHLALSRKQSTPHCESSISDDGMIWKTQQRHINSFDKIKEVLLDVLKIEIWISIIYKKLCRLDIFAYHTWRWNVLISRINNIKSFINICVCEYFPSQGYIIAQYIESSIL